MIIGALILLIGLIIGAVVGLVVGFMLGERKPPVNNTFYSSSGRTAGS